MSKARIIEIENFPLADGGHAIVRRLGDSYSFTRTYNSFEQAPDVHLNLSEDAAYGMLLDVIKNDLMEVD